MKKRVSTAFIYSIVILAVLLTAGWSSRAIEVIADHQASKQNTCIILDAGHGGLDGGAISCTGKAESGYNLDISLRLNDLFHLMGYNTKMIRKSDESVYTGGDTIAQKKSFRFERTRKIGKRVGKRFTFEHSSEYLSGRKIQRRTGLLW